MAQSASHIRWNRLSGKSVLIIDDSLLFYKSSLPDLARSGCMRVTACPTLQKAERHLSNRVADILVVSADLGGKSGFEFVRALRSLGSQSVIALASATFSLEAIERAVWSGADDFFVKNHRLALVSEVIALSQRRHLGVADRSLPIRLVDSTFIRCIGLSGFEHQLLDFFYPSFPCQKELAWSMQKSYSYIRKTFSRIYEKFTVQNQAQLAYMLALCNTFSPCDSGIVRSTFP